MRLTAAVGFVALLVVSCGTTADDAGIDVPTVPTFEERSAPTRYVAPTDFPRPDPSEPFGQPTMDRMFPAGPPQIVVWVVPPQTEVIGRISPLFEGPDGEAGDGRWDIPPPGEEPVRLTSLSLPADRYDLVVAVTQLSTDTSEADTVGPPLTCRLAVDAAAGGTMGIRLSLDVVFLADEPSEMCGTPPSPQWRDALGDPVPPTELEERPGPAHCRWERAQFLFYAATESLYVADPEGTIEPDNYLGVDGETLDGFVVMTALPPDAEFTGLRSNGRELWISDTGGYAYVRSADRVERWPRAELLCA